MAQETYHSNFRDSVITVLEPARDLSLVVVDVNPVMPEIGTSFVVEHGVDLVFGIVKIQHLVFERLRQLCDPCYFE
jgi:hypothetical protein